MTEMKKLSACAAINQHAYTIPLVYNSRGLASIRREGSMDLTDMDNPEWEDMPEGYISDITDEELEHIVEDLLAAETYLDDMDLSE